MKNFDDKESLQQISVTQEQHQNNTPDSLVREQGVQHPPSRKLWTFNARRCMFLLMIIIASTIISYEINAQDPPHIISHNTISDPEDFNFLVFCPVSYFHQTNSFKQSNFRGSDQLRRRLYETYSNRIEVIGQQKGTSNYDPNRTYLVQVTSANYSYTDTSGNPQSTIELFYCGLVTGFYQSCDDSVVACSTPGPIFDIPTREPVDIIWVNNFNPQFVPQAQSCLNSTDFSESPQYCTLMAKVNKTQTFYDATKNDISSKTAYVHVPITKNTWPMVTHLHGAEIRPTFDGNPLSWIHNSPDQKGNYGIAAFTYESECYYSSFDSIGDDKLNYNPPNIILRDIKTGAQNKNYKINRYPNQQNPGSLWYHDHAMHLTSFNVANGLSGYYILRDEKVEELIGIGRKCQKLVMLAGNSLTTSFALQTFKTGQVYRFKFLNNNFDDTGDIDVARISFSYNGCRDKVIQRQTFTIIGADSSLFNTGIYGQKSFVVAQAERLELLIKFQPGQDNFSICADDQIDKPSPTVINENIQTNSHHKSDTAPINSIFNIKLIDYDLNSDVCSNTRTSIQDVVLPVPFIDLSIVPDEEIAVKRMRPLIWVRPTFTINGRSDFHQGQSENPVLGTIEDWFIINTIFFSHPIHVHLINFQVVRQYDLRTLRVGKNKCSLYELDFVLTALQSKNFTDDQINSFKNIIFANNSINYSYLCNDTYKTLYSLHPFKQALETVYLENVTDANRVSGINVLENITSEQYNKYFKSINSQINPPFDFSSASSNLRYVPNLGAPSDKVFYARWKDTAYVEAFKVLQYRIRWTKSNFTQQDKKAGTYFHVPADQLRQYPGFVYHCHILPHEDNEMMRPIMLQLPKNVKLNLKTPCNYNIDSKQPVLKWSEKYNCVNKVCNNQPT